jgi:phosphoenolpyruvate synthase/pyruvate phosphate dikinase
MRDVSNDILWFKDIRLEDVPLVGGKNASLGELYRELAAHDVRVPNGFALTVAAYRAALPAAGAWPRLLALLRLAVAGARRNGRKVGICGEAPANYPEIARFLTEIGIDSISVNPSSLLRTIGIVREAETTRQPAAVRQHATLSA